MHILSTDGEAVSEPASVVYARCTVDLTLSTVGFADIACANLEDVLGGFGRSFQILSTRGVTDAYSPTNPLLVNTGVLTGTNVMTGLRTYFSAYSPLKVSNKGLPAAIFGGKRQVRVEAEMGRRRRNHPRGQGAAPHASRASGITQRPQSHPGASRSPAGIPLLQENPGVAPTLSRRPFRGDRPGR